MRRRWEVVAMIGGHVVPISVGKRLRWTRRGAEWTSRRLNCDPGSTFAGQPGPTMRWVARRAA